MRRLLNIVALETTIKTVDDLKITDRTSYKMTENSKTSLKHLTKELPPEALLEEMMRLSQGWAVSGERWEVSGEWWEVSGERGEGREKKHQIPITEFQSEPVP